MSDLSDLVTLEAVKAYSGIETDEDDTMLAALITAYSGWVRAYTNRDFTLQTYTRTFDGLNNTRQMLPQYPVVSVQSVSIGALTIPVQPAFGQSGFRFDDKSVVLEGHRFARGLANVTIAWTAGYAVIPFEVAEAVIELVGLRYATRDKQGWTSKTLAGETVAINTRDMPASVKTVLDSLRSVVPV